MNYYQYYFRWWTSFRESLVVLIGSSCGNEWTDHHLEQRWYVKHAGKHANDVITYQISEKHADNPRLQLREISIFYTQLFEMVFQVKKIQTCELDEWKLYWNLMKYLCLQRDFYVSFINQTNFSKNFPSTFYNFWKTHFSWIPQSNVDWSEVFSRAKNILCQKLFILFYLFVQSWSDDLSLKR